MKYQYNIKKNEIVNENHRSIFNLYDSCNNTISYWIYAIG